MGNHNLNLFAYECVSYIYSFIFPRGFASEGVEVVRPYTPTTLDTDVGYFDLVVKVRLPFWF